jgi:hypothetical protein
MGKSFTTMNPRLSHSSTKIPLGTAVLYKPKRPRFFKDSHLPGLPAVIKRYSRFNSNDCFIEFPSGAILRVPESDIEPVAT